MVLVVASNQGAIVGEQSSHNCLRNGDLLIVQYHHPYIFYGDSAHTLFLNDGRQVGSMLYLRQFDDQLIEPQTQVGGIGKTNHSLYRPKNAALNSRLQHWTTAVRIPHSP